MPLPLAPVETGPYEHPALPGEIAEVDPRETDAGGGFEPARPRR